MTKKITKTKKAMETKRETRHERVNRPLAQLDDRELSDRQ